MGDDTHNNKRNKNAGSEDGQEGPTLEPVGILELAVASVRVSCNYFSGRAVACPFYVVLVLKARGLSSHSWDGCHFQLTRWVYHCPVTTKLCAFAGYLGLS